MTQCSFIGSVAFALRCARRSRFTTLSRIFPPSLSVSRSPRRPCFSLVSPFRLSSFLFPRQLPLFHATFPAVQPLSDASFSRKIAWHSLLIRRSTTYRWRYFCVAAGNLQGRELFRKICWYWPFYYSRHRPIFPLNLVNMLCRDKWKSNVIYTWAIGKLIKTLLGRE